MAHSKLLLLQVQKLYPSHIRYVAGRVDEKIKALGQLNAGLESKRCNCLLNGAQQITATTSAEIVLIACKDSNTKLLL